MIIGLTGRISAGKETIKDFFIKKGFSYSVLSQILRDEMQEKAIPITRNSLQDYGDMLRKKQDAGVLMKIFLNKIDKNKNYIIDGIRNPGEILELKKYKSILIAVDAPQKMRFERMLKRDKPSDPKTWEEFLKVDERDFCDKDNLLGQQVGKCMEMADYIIKNEGDIEKSMKEVERIWDKIKYRISNNYLGFIIEESLEDKTVLKEVKIISTKIEKVTEKHKTPWISKWTLHTIEIPEKDALIIADKISRSLDKEHNWYADFKNEKYHFIIFRNKVFKIDVHSKEQYNGAKEYGISLGILEYQVDFHPEVEEWKR